jgi:hypothetical protein
MLICDGDSGYFFEIDSNNNIVWEYINPDTNNGLLYQGETASANFVFRAIKFSKDYAAFTGKDLTPAKTVELNVNGNTCEVLNVNPFELSNNIYIYPNPTTGIIYVSATLSIDKIEIYNTLGKFIKVVFNNKNITLENAYAGVYFIKIYSGNTILTKKIIKI